MKLDTSLNHLDLNLQSISMSYCTDGWGSFLLEIPGYEVMVRILVNELNLHWKSKAEVTTELQLLSEDQHFRDRVCFDEIHELEWNQFREDLINHGFTINWTVDEEYKDAGYLMLPNECFNYFNSVSIPRESSTYGFFLAVKIGRTTLGRADYISEILDYQLRAQFHSNLSLFSKTLIALLAEQSNLFQTETKDFVRDWIQLKQNHSLLGNVPQTVGTSKTAGVDKSSLSLPEFIGDDWDNFKSGFIELIQNHAKTRTSTEVFQQVMYGLWKYRIIPDKRWTQVIHVAIAFLQHFSEPLNVDKDSLRKHATPYKEVTNKTKAFDIEKPFDEFCLKFSNKDRHS